MTENILGTDKVCQVGLVVHDIEKSLDAYCALLGISRPKVIITDGYEQAQTAYHGQPSRARAKLAFIDLGQVQLELIEPDGNPSTWQEGLDKNGDSVHHIAFVVKGTGQVVDHLAQQGMLVAQQGQYTGGMYTYIDSVQKLGVNLELLENFGK
jgi:methylmalonyl-CoA/ethylmalonyl-CoA epimerase